jgi:hypothetical protein
MADQTVKNYVAVTVNAEPRVFRLREEDMPRRRLEQGIIFHSWLCAGATDVVGVKFSSWMIKHRGLTAIERSVVSRWNQSESDFEVFFGTDRDYDHDDTQKDETGSTCMMHLDANTLALCFPVHGSMLGKAGAAALAASLTDWTATR